MSTHAECHTQVGSRLPCALTVLSVQFVPYLQAPAPSPNSQLPPLPALGQGGEHLEHLLMIENKLENCTNKNRL